jgi:S-adenosylmethionine hydrolase
VKAVLAARAPGIPVVDATHSVPDFGIEPAAHLLAALAAYYPRGCVFLAVVDPGVGGKRDAIVVEAEGRQFVGPDNGLLSVVWQRARRRKCFRIAWRPRRLSSSFHGRDLFAPVAAALAAKRPRGWLKAQDAPRVLLDPSDLARVIYIDHFGNCMTGMRAESLGSNAWLRVGRRVLPHARTFEEAGGPFWYENSIGLAEIAVPQGSAARTLRLRTGQRVGNFSDERQARRAIRRAQ